MRQVVEALHAVPHPAVDFITLEHGNGIQVVKLLLFQRALAAVQRKSLQGEQRQHRQQQDERGQPKIEPVPDAFQA